ncbi:unnamed protein product [Amoebophrya sp. A25]|nr:unnamed protein product [Amoebophrya sp. A25]|eukprot:GSA25T00023641001.1
MIGIGSSPMPPSSGCGAPPMHNQNVSMTGGGTASSSSTSVIVDEEDVERRLRDRERRVARMTQSLDQRWQRAKPVITNVAEQIESCLAQVEERPRESSRLRLEECLSDAQDAMGQRSSLASELILQRHTSAVLDKLKKLAVKATNVLNAGTAKGASTSAPLRMHHGYLASLMQDSQRLAQFPAECRRLRLFQSVRKLVDAATAHESKRLAAYSASLVRIAGGDDGQPSSLQVSREGASSLPHYWAQLERFPDLFEAEVASLVNKLTTYLRDTLWRSIGVSGLPGSASRSGSKSPSSASGSNYQVSIQVASDTVSWTVAEVDYDHPADTSAALAQSGPGEQIEHHPHMISALQSFLQFLRTRLHLGPASGGNRVWRFVAETLLRPRNGTPMRRTLRDLRRAESKDLAHVADADSNFDNLDTGVLARQDMNAARSKDSTSTSKGGTAGHDVEELEEELWERIDTLEAATREELGLHSLSIVGDLLREHQKTRKMEIIGRIIERSRRLLYRGPEQKHRSLSPGGPSRQDAHINGVTATSVSGIAKTECETELYWTEMLRPALEAGPHPLQKENLEAAETLVFLFLLVRCTQRGDLSRDAALCGRFFRDANALCDRLASFGVQLQSRKLQGQTDASFQQVAAHRRGSFTAGKDRGQEVSTAQRVILRLSLQIRKISEDKLRELVATFRGSLTSQLAAVASAESANEVSTALAESVHSIKTFLQTLQGALETSVNLMGEDVRSFLAREFAKDFAAHFQRFKKSTLDNKVMEALLHLQCLGLPESELLEIRDFFTEEGKKHF